MIIFDYSQLFMSCMFTQSPQEFSAGHCDTIMRHLVFNSIRATKKRFVREFGNNVIIACEGGNTWRRQFFPYYKAARKAARKTSLFDSTKMFDLMKTIREEIKQYFPYKVLSVYEAEADDIIGTLTLRYYSEEPILIVSRDKDFAQLDCYKNVKRFDSIKKVILRESNAEAFLLRHIITGDESDGIPNILSPENSFVAKIRQKPITSKFLRESTLTMNSDLTRFLQNKTLIDLRETPLYIQELIVNEYQSIEHQTNRGKIRGYFIEKQLLNLLDDIQDF